jgi:hypothetical protein
VPGLGPMRALYWDFFLQNFTTYDSRVRSTYGPGCVRCTYRPGCFCGFIFENNWGSGHPWSLFDGKTDGGAVDLYVVVGHEAV